MTDIHVHSQREGKLLSMPVEIRQAIYGYILHGQTHVFLSQGRLQLSVCLQPNLGDDRHDGNERKPRGEEPPYTMWARRLRSSWGAHWGCETAYAERENGRNHIYNLLFVCKKMFLDVCDFVSERTAIIITDLDTLDVLLQTPFEPSSDLSRPWNFWDCTRPAIRKLNIALRLPLAFYEALQEDETLGSVTNHDTSILNKCATWARLWPAVCQLSQLRSLHIWLDHNDRPSWSFVNERVALRHVIAALMARIQACSKDRTKPHMDITLNLPKLHPRYAGPDTHFFEESPPPPFYIERRIRQRVHCDKWPSGSLSVVYKADFPVLHELAGLCGGNYECQAVVGTGTMCHEDHMTLEEVEDFERKLWERGENAYDEIRGFSCVPDGFREEDEAYMSRLETRRS